MVLLQMAVWQEPLAQVPRNALHVYRKFARVLPPLPNEGGYGASSPTEPVLLRVCHPGLQRELFAQVGLGKTCRPRG